MKLSVAIINYNDYQNTINFIDSIKDYNVISHIVVVDNLSTDNSLIELKKINNPKVKIIANPINSGYGEGINIAARYLINNRVDGIMMVCNTDIVIGSEADIIKMMGEFKNNSVAVVAPIIDENGTIRYGFKINTIKEELLMSIPKLYNKYANKYHFYQEYNHVVDAIMGCVFMIRLDILSKIDYFDSNMFLYYEENVLALKLKEVGKKSVVCKDVVVKHNHSKTIDKSIKRVQKYQILKQSQRYYLKNYLKAGFISLFIFDVIVFTTKLFLNIKGLFERRK